MAVRGSTCVKRSRSKKTGSAKMRGRRTWMTLTAPHSRVPSVFEGHKRERERGAAMHSCRQQVMSLVAGCMASFVGCTDVQASPL